MSADCDKLWEMPVDKKMNRADLKNATGINFNVLAKMDSEEILSMEGMLNVCEALDCDISDVVEVSH